MPTTIPKIKIGKDTITRFEQAIGLEWIITNGLGTYASQSILGINTRKYHGLLVASYNPPVDRRVILSKADEQLSINDEIYLLGANEYRDTIYPQGYQHLSSFSRFPFPQFTYKIKDVTIKKTILIPYGENATIINYTVDNPRNKDIKLQIAPLINSRHFHSTSKKEELTGKIREKNDYKHTKIGITDSNIILGCSTGNYIPEGTWIENIFFRIDNSRGTSSFEDCYSPGRFEISTKPDEVNSFNFWAVTSKDIKNAEAMQLRVEKKIEDFNEFYENEIQRLQSFLTRFEEYSGKITSDWQSFLILAADAFITNRSSTDAKTVIAGYHWFEDWGRDSLISLPGLTLVTGRFEDARAILFTFAHYQKKGIIPNRFPDKTGDQPVYNTVDATLWYINAVFQYLKYTNDYEFVKKKLWKTLQSVIVHHMQGTINKIHLDNDALLKHGPQLTWMDAMIGKNAVTPRKGKAVEIQALWYNALKIMELLATHYELQELNDEYRELAAKTKKSFLKKFWNKKNDCLFDVINAETKDNSIRPNQVLAVSLDFSMLNTQKQHAVVSTVQKKLWTKYGLRTITPTNPLYKGKYTGGWNERNSAYHNGTVWPWMTGHFITAFLKTKQYASHWRKYAYLNFLKPLVEDQTLKAGIGTLSEIFDGDNPHKPRGSIAQAWSIAETLRTYVEDIMLHRPNFEKDIITNLHGEYLLNKLSENGATEE